MEMDSHATTDKVDELLAQKNGTGCEFKINSNKNKVDGKDVRDIAWSRKAMSNDISSSGEENVNLTYE